MKNKRIDILVMLMVVCLISISATGKITVAALYHQPMIDSLPVSQLTLMGSVKNLQGLPLSHVNVAAGNTVVTSTDSTGAFNLTIDNKPTILTFSLEKMVTVKRSYHPFMQEKSFNIIMEKDSCKYCARIMEAIRGKN